MARAISILATNRLFMGRQAGMNDINESYRSLAAYVDAGGKSPAKTQCLLRAAERQLHAYRQTSLSIDGKFPGFAIPAMWGHYADKGTGVCIVFDKDDLVRRLGSIRGYYFERVKYIKDFDPNITISGSPAKYFRENIRDIFFNKSDCWEYEQEFRIIRCAADEPANIDISGCVMAIVMCYAEGDNNHQSSCFCTEAYRKLKLLFPDYPILEWSTGPCGSNLRDADGNQWFPDASNENIYLDV